MSSQPDDSMSASSSSSFSSKSPTCWRTLATYSSRFCRARFRSSSQTAPSWLAFFLGWLVLAISVLLEIRFDGDIAHDVLERDDAGEFAVLGDKEPAAPGLLHESQGLDHVIVRADGVLGGAPSGQLADAVRSPVRPGQVLDLVKRDTAHARLAVDHGIQLE